MTTTEDKLEVPVIQPTSSHITWASRWIHIKARFGIRRSRYRIEPGLYALGSPNQGSLVFVSANYILSYDTLRSSLHGLDCYILVLDTKGINVWCAAGKGTFGTDELVNRIVQSGCGRVVKHRKLIVPQLGAPGISAHEVKQRSGFKVEYGPIRANDLPEYLIKHEATDEMRRVGFSLRDRLTLIPVEIVSQILITVIIGLVFYLMGGILGALGAIAAVFTGQVLFPTLLPWIPTPNFSTKGFILGLLVALPFVLLRLTSGADVAIWQRLGWAITHLLLAVSITAFLALNFTGSTTFTSRSGVKREIFAYIPAMAWMFGCGLILSITLRLIQAFGA